MYRLHCCSAKEPETGVESRGGGGGWLSGFFLIILLENRSLLSKSHFGLLN